MGKVGISVVAILVALFKMAIAQEQAGSISKWGAAQIWKDNGWEFKTAGRARMDYATVDADLGTSISVLNGNFTALETARGLSNSVSGVIRAQFDF